jgi:hypothetical protein
MSGACSTHQADQKCKKFLVVKPKGNRPEPDLSLDGTIKLKCTGVVVVVLLIRI